MLRLYVTGMTSRSVACRQQPAGHLRRVSRGPVRSRGHRHLPAAGRSRRASRSSRHRRSSRNSRCRCAGSSATCRIASACCSGSISFAGLTMRSDADGHARTADHREQSETLRVRLAEAEEMLRAIQQGEIDALVVEGTGGNQVYTLHSAEEPYRNLVEQMQEGAVVLTSARRHPVRQRALRGARGRAAPVGDWQPASAGSCTRRTGTTSRPCCGAGQRPGALPVARPGFSGLRGESVAHHDQVGRTAIAGT